MVERVFVLRSSFIPSSSPYWEVNDSFCANDMVRLLTLSPGEDVLAVAEQEALHPICFGDPLQVRCVLVDNGSQCALVLIVSHLVADGGDAKYILKKLAELYNCILHGCSPDDVAIKNGNRDLLQVYDNVSPEALVNPETLPPANNNVKTVNPLSFPEPNDCGIPRIIRRTIPSDILAPARKKAKAMGPQ